MNSPGHSARRVSAGVFGNEKVVEVVLALEELSSAATAQDLARATGIAHGMVRDVLVRLAGVHLLHAVPKIGGARAPQYYVPADGPGWAKLVALAHWINTAALAADHEAPATQTPPTSARLGGGASVSGG